MSWTQGVLPREGCNEKQVQRMDEIGKIKLGEGFKFSGFVWDEAVPGVLYLDYMHEETKEIRSLKYRYDNLT